MTKRRIGLVGLGDVSSVHLAAITHDDDLDLVGVADRDPVARERAAAEFSVPAFEDVESLIAQASPDAVHVTTPHAEHVAPTLAALEAGVHVLQEKPLAHTLEGGQQLVAAADSLAAGADAPKIAVCFQNRYNRASAQAKALLESGELGVVQGAWASVVWNRTEEYYRAKPWRGTWEGSGGGLLINQAIHTLDLVQWLLGPVAQTDGQVSTRKFADVIEVEDTADLLLHHDGGHTTTFFATLTAPRARPVEIEISCENALLELRGGIGGALTVRWDDGRVDVVGDRVAPPGGRAYWGISHQELIADFYEHLDAPEPFWIGPREAMASLQILDAAYRNSGVGPYA